MGDSLKEPNTLIFYNRLNDRKFNNFNAIIINKFIINSYAIIIIIIIVIIITITIIIIY